MPHKVLIEKLQAIGLDDYLIQWISGSETIVQTECSMLWFTVHLQTLPIISDVPQGSILGTTSMIFLWNNLLSVVHSISFISIYKHSLSL